MEIGRIAHARGDLVNGERPEDRRMDRVLVVVDLGEHGVEMHERAAARDIEREHGADLRFGIGEEIADASSMASGEVRWEMPIASVSSVRLSTSPPLDVGVAVAVVVALDQTFKIGVEAENVVGVNGLAAAGREAHLMQEHAGADGRERVAGEVEVGHRIDDQIIRRSDQILQGISGSAAHFLERDAFHRLFDERLAFKIADEVLIELVLPAAGLDVALGEPLIKEGLRLLGMELENFRHQVFEIHDLGAVAAQDLREGIMLLLGDLEERDIVKEKLRKTVRRQMKKFTAGTVKKHFFQRLDLAANANTFHDLNLLHSVFWLRRSVALPHRHSDLLSLSYPTKPEILEERCGINCIFLHLSLYRKSTVLRFFGSHFPCFSFVKNEKTRRKNPARMKK